jgi:aspartokinase-like uncharacterized kinase
MAQSPIVVKVGGSLFDLPDLGPRLRCWLDHLPTQEVLLLPGGGAIADGVRDLDRCHGLGEERAHWLALYALALNARFLEALVPQSVMIEDLEERRSAWRSGQVPILDAYRFACQDEGQPGCLPHDWSVTSDSLAARVAQVLTARRLVLLKSASPPATGWIETSPSGYVDRHFADVIAGVPGLEVVAINFRAWQP